MEPFSSWSAEQHFLPAAIFLAMLTVGMELRLAQFRAVGLDPRVPILGSLIHSLTFPFIAAAAIVGVEFIGISLANTTVLGVLLVAACPSGGFSNVLTMLARANLPLSIVLTAVSSVLAFLSVPLLIKGFSLFAAELEGDVAIPVGQILIQLSALIVLPVALGMWLRQLLTSLVKETVARLQNYTQLLLYLTVGLVIAENLDAMKAGFFGSLPWSAGLCIGNIVGCYWLSRAFRMTPEDSVTIALEGSVRNLGVAFLIATNTLERPDIAVFPTVYFLSVLLFSILFAKTWRHLPGFGASRA